MAKKKRTDLDKTISRLQKNARNKIYRLRRAGASDEDIAAIDPRRPTKDMNGSQKAAYARALARFNARDNAYTVSEDYFGNRGLIPAGLIKRYREVEASVNKTIRQVQDRAIKLYGGKPYISSTDVEGKTKEEWERVYGPMRQSAYNAGYLEEVHRQYGFGSVRAVQNAIESVKKKITKIRQIDNNLSNYKKYIVNRMTSDGADPRTIKAVKSLTKSQLQYLYFNSDFSTIVQTYQYEEYYAQGYLRSQQIIELTDNQVYDMVRAAKRAVPRGRFTPLSQGL